MDRSLRLICQNFSESMSNRHGDIKTFLLLLKLKIFNLRFSTYIIFSKQSLFALNPIMNLVGAALKTTSTFCTWRTVSLATPFHVKRYAEGPRFSRMENKYDLYRFIRSFSKKKLLKFKDRK